MGVVTEFSHFLIGPACGATSLFFSEKKRYFQPPSVGVWLPSDKKSQLSSLSVPFCHPHKSMHGTVFSSRLYTDAFLKLSSQ